MPFKSKAQRRKFAELLVKGDISGETFEEWNRSTGSASLPERVHPKGPGKKKKAKKSTKAKKARARKAPRGRAKAKGKRRNRTPR
jgi:topoisomerase IA-like protein